MLFASILAIAGAFASTATAAPAPVYNEVPTAGELEVKNCPRVTGHVNECVAPRLELFGSMPKPVLQAKQRQLNATCTKAICCDPKQQSVSAITSTVVMTPADR